MKPYVIIFIILVCFLCPGWVFIFYPIAQIPTLTGPYGVGQTKYHWIDQSRQELKEQNPQHPHRALMVNVFHPTDKKISRAQTPYDPSAIQSAQKYFADCSKLPEIFFNSIKTIKTYAQPQAPLKQHASAFPVIIFSHGGNGPIVQSYTWMLE
jgi:predicted dienelactone hydrolase